ncbi:hypothetical protein [Sphingomonas sp. BK235]|uniref:hypothetical protein n=1 Tax=Sphingomonas sp. BK235 TaxID=2512131 RepID=UPI0010494ED9|nr:hypothetical protein [Sphingomonas sp. BK235]TCP32814.1 hypothetical protein EV292_107153 [Sphingomonas sp. BK235]
MTIRGLSVWFAVAGGLLAILVAVDRPQWFGLEASATGIESRAPTMAAGEASRSAPWKIDRQGTTER